MTDNDKIKIAKWAGWAKTNGGNWINPLTKLIKFTHPYYSTDAEAIALLPVLVEKGYFVQMECGNDAWVRVIIGSDIVEGCIRPTIHEAVTAAVLQVIEKEASDGI